LGLARHPEKFPYARDHLELQAVDLNEPDKIQKALDAFKPDVIFHASAYYPNRNLVSKSEVQSHLTSFFRQCHEIESVKPECVVYTSTIGTIPKRSGMKVVNEQSSFLKPPKESMYHYIKVQFERIFSGTFRNHPSIRSIIVNPGMVIAPHDPKPYAFNFMKRLVSGSIPAVVNHNMLVISGPDVGMGHVWAALRGKQGNRYILGSDQMMLKEFFKSAYRYLHISKPIIQLPLSLAMSASTFSEWWAWLLRNPYPGIPKVPLYELKYAGKYSLTKSRQELGFHPTPFMPELHNTLDWAKKVTG
jgi:dihydroflavonol-4-reductase